MSRKYIIITLCFCVTVLSGCDLMDSIKDSFSKKETKSAPVQASAPQKGAGPMPADALARVGNWTLTKSEFEERLKALKEIVPDYDVTDPQARRLVLDELVRQQLVVMAAEQSGMAAQKDITDAVDEFRRTLIVREAARKLTENLQVTEDEARQFYKENQDKIVEPYKYSVSEIVVADEVTANEIYVDLLKGADFAETARAKSISDSASKGGDLGVLTEDPFPAMVDAILELKEGEISKVFEGPDGYYIVKLDKKTGGEPIPFDDIKEDIIHNRTLFKQQQAILNYINGLREKFKVEVNEDLL